MSAGDDRKDVTVSILGRDYLVGGTLDPAYVRMLSTKVDGMLRALAEAAPNQDNEQLAVLTALNIADQLEQEKEKPAEQTSPALPALPAEQPPAAEPLPPDMVPRLTRCVRLLEEALQGKGG